MSPQPKSRILGLGTSVPDKILSNAELEKIVQTDDAWIVARTGIRERRMLAEGERICDFGAEACRRAMAEAGLGVEDIGAIIVCTYTPDYMVPATACLIHDILGMKTQAAFDMNAACSGFVYGLEMADLMVSSGRYRNVLLVGLEGQTRHLNWADRGTCILFGDGAGAVVVGPAEEGSDRGVLSTFLGADGTGWELLTAEATGSAHPPTAEDLAACRQCITMNGREVFKFAVRILGPAVDAALERAGLTVGDIDLLVPHQANVRIIDAAAERYGMSADRVVSNIAKYGNTSAASIPLALEDARVDGRLQPGKLLALVAFGAGLTYGSAIVRW